MSKAFLPLLIKAFLPLLIAFISTSLSPLAQAHELRPAFLSITEISHMQEEAQDGAQYNGARDGSTYNVLWKTPALGEKQLALKANFPKTCVISNGGRRVQENKFAIETWTLNCPQSLRGQSLSIGGLDKTLTDVLVRTEWLDGKSFTARLTPDKTRLDFGDVQSQGSVVKTYFLLGLQHILGGIDHLLFVLAVMLLVTKARKLFYAITAFTLGHSVTLALASLDIVRMQPSLVETLIAMSIVLMAYEAARRWRGQSGLTLEYPWLVTFSFGLLHGFGFAGALRAIGLPQTDLPAALLFFNVGVEAGQLLFVTVVITAASLPFLKRAKGSANFMTMTSYGIGVISVFWMLQRALPILSQLAI
jgi:hydrogenase/urease accessory protein HupE